MIKAIDFYKEKYEIKGKKFYPLIGNWRKQFNSLMTYDQMSFLMSVIEENKMNNVLEIGVFNGVSSMAILTAGLSSNKNFNLYIDNGKRYSINCLLFKKEFWNNIYDKRDRL